MAMLEGAEVHDTHGKPVPRDAAHLGEIAMRGNMVMKGYYKNPQATAEAFKGGWFRSGDIAFQHPDGYIKITDRAKDIIISGGENVSSVEVEGVLAHHPAVSLCAVVAKPDDKWGEVPCAFVELKQGHEATEDELDRLCPQAPCRVQDTQAGGVLRLAQDIDRQDPEVRAARRRQAFVTAIVGAGMLG